MIRGFLPLLLVALTAAVAGCGGGSGGGRDGGGSQPPPDFSLSPSRSSLALQQLGGGVVYSVAITPVNGFSGVVAITFVNFTAGVTEGQGFQFCR